MGKAYSFDGIKMTSSGYDYDTGLKKRSVCSVPGMTVSTSDNGTNWKAQGEIESDAEDCVFLCSVDCPIYSNNCFECWWLVWCIFGMWCI